jgi:hypothetical protein
MPRYDGTSSTAATTAVAAARGRNTTSRWVASRAEATAPATIIRNTRTARYSPARYRTASGRSSGGGSGIRSSGRRSRAHDHLVVHDVAALGELVGNAVVLDVRDIAGSPGEFYSTVSDHLPIVGVFRVGGPDDDPAP